MEFVSNFLWMLVALGLLSGTYRSVRRGSVSVEMKPALLLALLLAFILLPAISVSDDLMKSRQSDLPLSAQTYLVASESASVGFDLLPLAGMLLMLLLCFVTIEPRMPVSGWSVRPQAARLTRQQRLRPPPMFA